MRGDEEPRIVDRSQPAPVRLEGHLCPMRRMSERSTADEPTEGRGAARHTAVTTAPVAVGQSGHENPARDPPTTA